MLGLLVLAQLAFGQNQLVPFPYTLCSSTGSCVVRNTQVTATAGNYGLDVSGNSVSMGLNRLSLVNPEGTAFEPFYVKNRQLTFTTDISQVPCGWNAAMYFTGMSLTSSISNTSAYCDAQSGCMEMDVMEANIGGQQMTIHECANTGVNANSQCDQWGCLINTRTNPATNTTIGAGLSGIDVLKPFTVTTRWHTTDGTDKGNLSYIEQVFTQGTHSVTVGNLSQSECAYLPSNMIFGGIAKMSLGLDAGMVLILSVWEAGAGMTWLDGDAATPPNPVCSEYTSLADRGNFSNFILGPIGTPLTVTASIQQTATTAAIASTTFASTTAFTTTRATTSTIGVVSSALVSTTTSATTTTTTTTTKTTTTSTTTTTTTTTTTKATTSASSSPSPSATTAASAIAATTTAAVKTTTATTASSTACNGKYGQCGGISWSGATCCVASTCTVMNSYYSQCI